MNLFTDRKIRCPFNKEHVVSEKKLKWHISRCECDKIWKAKNPGKQIYRCPNNWQHMFFVEADLILHLRPLVCNKDDHN
jgi:hypothetical protein